MSAFATRVLRWIPGAFSVVCLGVAVAGSEFPVVSLDLDETRVATVPTHPGVGLLIHFPHPISDFAGRGFCERPEANRGDFMLRFLAGDPYLVVTPLTPGAKGTLHVVVAGKVYSLQLVPADYEQAWQKLLFTDVERTGGSGESSEVSRMSSPPSKQRLEKPSARRLIGALELGRWLRGLPNEKAAAVVRANPALRIAFKGSVSIQGEACLKTDFVVRNDILDTLIFAVTVENCGKRTLEFKPDSWMVRVGDHVYPSLAVDFNPLVPAGASSKALFAVAGDGAGRPNWLSPENTFRISLLEVNAAQPRPASST